MGKTLLLPFTYLRNLHKLRCPVENFGVDSQERPIIGEMFHCTPFVDLALDSSPLVFFRNELKLAHGLPGSLRQRKTASNCSFRA